MTEITKKAKMGLNRTLVSTVWLVPLLAFLTGGYLLLQNIQNKGIEVTLLMDNAEGIEVNQTRIRVLNVDVGRVHKIRLRSDQKGVEVTAKLNKDVADLIKKDTQFWVVKPRIDGNGVSGLATLVSGAYIAFNPGSSAEAADTFKVSDLPPITAIGQNGLRLKLKGKSKNRVGVGSPVLFESYEVGRVETVNFNPTSQTIEYSIFIDSPNEALVNSSSIFWLDRGINVKTDASGINVHTPPLSALLTGAIVFDTPHKHVDTSQTVQNGTSFAVYENRAEVDLLPDVSTLYYVVFLKQSVRGLQVGAPVEYKGLNIGSVADVPYFQNQDNLNLFQNNWIPVRIRIDPHKLEQGKNQQSRTHWQTVINQALNKGLGVTLSNHNLILGSKMLELSDSDISKAFRPYTTYGGLTVIASHQGEFDDLQVQVGKLLDKFNALPLEQTVGGLNNNLQQLQRTLNQTQNILQSAEHLLKQPSTQALPQTLNQTLQELQTSLQNISPQSPMYQDIQKTIKSLETTLNEVKPLVQTLKEQPDALIFNRHHGDPIPKGKIQ